MSDGLIIGIVLLVGIGYSLVRVIHALATGKKINIRPFYPERRPLDPHNPKNHGLSPGDVGYNPFDTHPN